MQLYQSDIMHCFLVVFFRGNCQITLTADIKPALVASLVRLNAICECVPIKVTSKFESIFEYNITQQTYIILTTLITIYLTKTTKYRPIF